MLTVLFVDDEPSILQGTRRATRQMRQAWDMHFVESGSDALEFLTDRSADVVVSDMRMPGMDGAEFLARVKEHLPSAARVILSGHSEEEAIFRSTRVAHQFLSKPCDVEQLKDTIELVRRSRERVAPTTVRDLVGQLDELPALGSVYEELMAAMTDPNSTNLQLGEIVSQDIALTAEILRLVNSAFFGLARRVESVGQAIGFLGANVVRAIVASHSLFGSDQDSAIDLAAVVERSQAVAALARRSLVRQGVSAMDAGEAYMAGVLHEVGVLVLSRLPTHSPDELRAVLSADDLTNERLAFGVDRYLVGAYLLGLWGFDADLVDAVTALSEPNATAPEALSDALKLGRSIAMRIEGPGPGSILRSDEEELDRLLVGA
ncbi:MAG: HDOD domain-containing protein [Actinomycetota bacterium]